jgi:hypothetical protein
VSRCLRRENTSACVSLIRHSRVPGADRYVVETQSGASVPCSGGNGSVVCIAVFPNGPPGCGTTLRAVDEDGRLGDRSETFCVNGVDDQLGGSNRQQNATLARAPGARANG